MVPGRLYELNLLFLCFRRSMREISLCYISRRRWSPNLSRLKHKRKMCLFLMFHYIFISQIQNAPVGSPQRQEAQKNLLEEINHRKKIDQNIIEILRVSLNQTNVLDLLTSTRTTGQSLVDDWDCFKTLVTNATQILLLILHVTTSIYRIKHGRLRVSRISVEQRWNTVWSMQEHLQIFAIWESMWSNMYQLLNKLVPIKLYEKKVMWFEKTDYFRE